MPTPPLKKKHIPQTLQEAMALHDAGQIAEAEILYQRILGADGKDINALLNLSTLYSQSGQLEQALPLLKRLLPLVPSNAYTRFAYANVLMKLKRYEEALASFDKAIAFEPKNPNYHFNRALTLDALNRLEEALSSYNRAIELQPNYTEALINHANNLYRLERFAEALTLCDSIIRDQPDLALAYNTRGNVHGALGKPQEALADYNKAIALQPDLAIAHNNRGNILGQTNDATAALSSYDEAITLNPLYTDALNNRATALNKLGRHEEALATCHQILSLNPELAQAYDTRGNAYVGLHRFIEGLADYDKALALQPTLTTTPWNKALTALLIGNLEEGYALYESRWKTEFQRDDVRSFAQPLWLGQIPLAGKTLYIYPEQGFGDYIQFSRYLPLLTAMGANLLVEAPTALLPLLKPSFPDPSIRFLEPGDALPEFDLQCPVMSLPHAFQTTLNTIPNPGPYLQAPPSRQTKWQERLGTKTRKRIGLVWSGSTAHIKDAKRSLPLAALAPLFALPFEFHSLQKEIRPSDEAALGKLITHQQALEDFADTAALVAAMDLVISVDTSVAHLAGALGTPLWVMLPHTPDYRWLLDREDSPWYPSARLFRQPAPDDWSSVVARLVDRLEKEANHA